MKPGTQGTPGVREEPTIPVMTGSGRSKAVRAPEPQEHQSQRATALSKDWEVPTLKHHQGQLKLRETKALRYGATYLKTKERTVNF